tara:strand:+ start:4739 stop:7951 length:3213 start_codon:yes stop_codon:yes gene_type:complete
MLQKKKRLDDIELVRKIASGGMAEVWEARQIGVEGFEKRLAVKVILPHLTENEDFIRMFLDEGRLAARLNHPNICQIYKLGHADDVYYMAMEYIDGFVLNHLIKQAIQSGVLIPYEYCCAVVMDVCTGLDHAHRLKNAEQQPLNIVHRDISPPNIMISLDGHVKIVDFGVAKAVTQLHLTKTGVVKGKYAYMSPEQIDDQPIDQRTDVFALGVVLWELSTGYRLFYGNSEAATLKKIITAQYERPSLYRKGYPKGLEAIVMKAISYDRDERYADCGELLEDLESFMMDQGMVAGARRLARYVRWLMDGAASDQLGERNQQWAQTRESAVEKVRSVDEHTQGSYQSKSLLLEKQPGEKTPISNTQRQSISPPAEELNSRRFHLEPTADIDSSPKVLESVREKTPVSMAQQAPLSVRQQASPSVRQQAPLNVRLMQWEPESSISSSLIARSRKSSGKRQLLLVDDQEEILDAVRVIFRSAGYEVHTAQDGIEAVERVQETSYDLCVLDLDMPRLDGRGALQQIRQLCPSLPCIIQTANHSFQEAAELGRLGAVTYLPKPVKRKILLKSAKEALDHRPKGDDFERVVQDEYPTPLAEVRYRFRNSPERKTTVKVRHGLLAAQFEMLLSWLGTITMACYVHDRTFDPGLNRRLQQLAGRMGPHAWIRLLAAAGDVYREKKLSFLSRELRDLLIVDTWKQEEEALLLRRVAEVVAPLVGFDAPEEITPIETMQILADYYDDMWRDDSLLEEREVEKVVEVLDPFLYAIFRRIYRLIDFDLVRVDSVELTREGVHHDLTILRGLNPEHSTYISRRGLEKQTLYLFDRVGRKLFPLMPFMLAVPSEDKSTPNAIAFPVRLDPDRRMVYRNASTGLLHRPDAYTQKAAKDLFEGLLTPEERARLFRREITVLFTDLEGSTRFYDEHGDVAGRLLVQTHDNLLFPIIEAHQGRVIKTIGDAIMASFEVPHRAILAATEMQRMLEEYNQESTTLHPIRIRIGIHRGEGIVEEHDVYGDVVNTAARIQHEADALEIVISQGMVDACQQEPQMPPFEPAGLAQLKGKEKGVSLFRVVWQSSS